MFWSDGGKASTSATLRPFRLMLAPMKGSSCRVGSFAPAMLSSLNAALLYRSSLKLRRKAGEANDGKSEHEDPASKARAACTRMVAEHCSTIAWHAQNAAKDPEYWKRSTVRVLSGGLPATGCCGTVQC